MIETIPKENRHDGNERNGEGAAEGRGAGRDARAHRRERRALLAEDAITPDPPEKPTEPDPPAQPTPDPPAIQSVQTAPREDVERDVIERWKDAVQGADMEVYRPTLMPSAQMWDQITRMAESLSKAMAMPDALRGKPADIALVLLTGRDVGVGPTTAINRIHVIKGRPTMAAELMRALIVDRGHDLWFEDVSDESVTICGHRKEWPTDRVARVTWTVDDATRAQLAAKDVWKQYPRSMLKARATSEIGRDNFADVLLGVSYTPEEMGAEVDEAGEPLKIPSAWSENSTDAPAYEPAPQIVIDAYLAKIDALDPDVKQALAAKWKELRLRPLRPTKHEPRILAVDEVALAATAIAQAVRETPEEAETVEQSIRAAGGAQTPTEGRTGEPEAVSVPVARAEQLVADMPPSQVDEALDAFGEETPARVDEDGRRRRLVELLAARTLCSACGALRDGPEMAGEALCGCEVTA